MDIQKLFISMNGTVKVKQISRDSFKVFHNNTKALGIINCDGKILLELCNGKRRIREIIDEIEKVYANNKEEIEDMVVAGLKHFKWISLVKTSSDEIIDSYSYRVFNSEISEDHVAFDLSKILIDYNDLKHTIEHLAERGIFQITFICDKNTDIEIVSNMLDVCNECEIVTNIFFNNGVYTYSSIENIGKNINGKIIFELINYKDENISNSIIKRKEVIKVIRELGVPVDVQIRTNNVKEFEETIKISSLLDLEKVYYNFTDVSLKDEFEISLDKIETQLLGQCHRIPELIFGNWYDCRDNEIIALYDNLKMEARTDEN